MKSLITIFSEAHVFMTVSFYFALFISAFSCPLLSQEDTFFYRAMIIPCEVISLLFLTTNSLSVFKLIFVAEIIYYIMMSLYLLLRKDLQIIVMIIIGIVAFAGFRFSGILPILSELNLRWYPMALIFSIFLFVFIEGFKTLKSSGSKIHIINAVSSVILLFILSQDGVFIMLLIRGVFFSLMIRHLMLFKRSAYDANERRYELIQKDFDDEVRKKVKSHLFHMELSREKMAEIAKKDDMTGVFNKKTILDAIKDKISDKRVSTFSLLIFDIDKFKTINDELGHIQGDKCIVQVSRMAEEVVRGKDMVGRYGGDEFFVLLDGADIRTAIVVAERLRQKVNETEDPHYTISVGIGNYPVDSENVKDLVKFADDGLYLAKKKGGNSLGYFTKKS